MNYFSLLAVQITKSKILFIGLLFWFQNSFTQKNNFLQVDNVNYIKTRTFFQNEDGFIALFSTLNIADFFESIDSNVNLNHNQLFVQLVNKSNFYFKDFEEDFENKLTDADYDVANSILIKLPFELNQQLIQKTLPSDWYLTTLPSSKNYIYSIKRNALGQCSKESQLNLLIEGYNKCIELLKKSEKTTEYLTYQVNLLSTDKNKIRSEFNCFKDSLDKTISQRIQAGISIEKSKSNIGFEFGKSLFGFSGNTDNITLSEINFSQSKLDWKYDVNNIFQIGIGISHSNNLFKTCIPYDSSVISENSNLGIPYSKSIIVKNLIELNKYSFNSVSFHLGYIKGITKSLNFELNSDVSFSPKFIINARVVDGKVDYVGYNSDINEPLINVSDLGLASNVNLINSQSQREFTAIGFSISSNLSFEKKDFFAKMGISFEHIQTNQYSKIESYTTHWLGEYNSSISQLNNFKINTLNLSFTLGFKI